jgi:hypothetical protein
VEAVILPPVKDCGKRADEVKINRLMATKNISAKEAMKIVKTTDHRPPRSPSFRPMEDFPLPDGGHSKIPLENPKMTPTTLNNDGSWRLAAR